MTKKVIYLTYSLFIMTFLIHLIGEKRQNEGCWQGTKKSRCAIEEHRDLVIF